MMKTYSIGRDLNCDIVINDSTDVISRRHALLNVTPSGKMTLIDQSGNGTYVNGIRISPNVPVPVTRKDIISFAHVAKLDWKQVPKFNLWIKYVVGGIIAVIAILAFIFGVMTSKGCSTNNSDQPTSEIVDSTAIKQKEAARLDSIKEVARQDSIKDADRKAASEDSQKAKKPTTPKESTTTKPKNEDKSKDKQDKDKDKSPTNKRPIV